WKMFSVLKYFWILQILYVVDARVIDAYYEGVKCDSYNRNIIAKIECWLSTDAKGQKTMNAILILKVDLNEILNHYKFLLTIKNNTNTYLSLELNICEALGALFTNPVTRMISEEIHRVSNFPYECPIRKGIRYVINNFTINWKLIPSFTPALKWYSNSIFFIGKKHALTFDAFGRVEHKRKKKNNKTKSVVRPNCVDTINVSIINKTKRSKQNNIDAYYEGVKCDSYNRNFIAKVDCWLSTDAKGQKTMNAILILKVDLHEILNHYKFFVTIKNNTKTYLSLELNICEALGALFTNPITRMISEEVHSVSNLPYECPLKKGIRYVVNNFTINWKMIPSFTPALTWYSNSAFFVGKKHVLTFDAFGRVEHRKKKNKNK
ncbi:hypothetical protein FF38_06594, partial [Lucilia cuprina]